MKLAVGELGVQELQLTLRRGSRWGGIAEEVW